MNRSRRHDRRAGATGETEGPLVDPVRGFVRMGFVALLVARALLPTEGTAEGSTILLAQASLLLGLLWTWSLLRVPTSRIRLLPLDAAFAALVVWQFVSALRIVLGVVDGAGDARAALNGAWEWAAVGVFYFVGRQVFDDRASARGLCSVLVGTTVGLGALGVWQSAVELPRLRTQYVEERDEIDRIEAIPAARRSPADARRLSELLLSWDTQRIPAAGPGRRAFESRLLGSSEPLGRFALANTFAGWLLPGTFALAGLLWAGHRRGLGRAWLVPLAAGLVVVLICLLLTKSRTAYVGLAAGVGVCLLPRMRGAERGDAEAAGHRNRRLWWIAGLVAVGLAVGLLVVLGGLDAAVVSQAPRSLAFRLQYWGATADVIREHPLLGTGPGNFRQHYLQHKWAEASEEIADPHNLFLEVWATAGTPALLALLAVVVLAVRTGLRAARDEELGPFVPAGRPSPWSDVRIGMLLGFATVAGWNAFLEEPEWPTFALVGGLAFAGSWTFERVSNELRLPVVALLGGAVALGVHLLGAGGVAMPAVQSMLVATFVVVTWQRAASVPASGVGGYVSGIVMLLLFTGGLMSTTLPVLGAGLESMSARGAQFVGRPDLARRSLERAVERDRFSPRAPADLAALEFGMWRASPAGNASLLRSAIRWQQEANLRDPLSATRRATLANMLAEGFRVMGDVNFGERAASSFAEAIRLYPTHAATHAEFAVLLADLARRDAAASAARRALELDAVNRREGHVDRVFDEELFELLEGIAAAGIPAQASAPTAPTVREGLPGFDIDPGPPSPSGLVRTDTERAIPLSPRPA